MLSNVPNQLDRRLMGGVNALNFADWGDSSPRKQMVASHVGQCLVVKGATERFLQTGMERQYAKTTFSVKMPEDAEVLTVIQRYKDVGANAIENPENILIYEGIESGEIGMLRLPRYFSDQTYFGFKYDARKITNNFFKGQRIPKGTIFLDSPSVTVQGDYKYGAQMRVAYGSHPAVIEDGIAVSRSGLKKLAITTFEKRDVEWGSRYIPLNVNGDETNYQPFPNIGDIIKPHGILMALRKDDRNLAIVEQSAKDLMEINYTHDRRVYAAGAGGKVIDIRIYHDDYNNSNTPEEMERQPMRYHRASQVFYREVLDQIKALETRRGAGLKLSKSLHRLAVEANAMLDNRANGAQERRVLLHRKNPLDDWRVEFVIEYEVVPTIGFKITDLHGGKGVIVAIIEDEDMPVDEHGHRAEILMDGNSTNSRMNVGRLYEQYFNAASRDVVEHLSAKLNLVHTDTALQPKLEALEISNPTLMDESWDYLMGYLKIMSPVRMYAPFTDGRYPHSRAHYLASVLSEPDGIILYMPPENEPEPPNIVRQLEAGPYKPLYGPVTYTGYSGRQVTTKNNIRIGSVYIILLEKIADDWTAVSSGKLQHNGVLSQITSWDKHAQPSRNQAIRAWGESEVRISVSFAGSRVTADILDRNNNPHTRRHVLDSILRADRPTDIEQVVNRKEVPYGGNKPLALVKHMALVCGWGFHYQTYKPSVAASVRS